MTARPDHSPWASVAQDAQDALDGQIDPAEALLNISRIAQAQLISGGSTVLHPPPRSTD